MNKTKVDLTRTQIDQWIEDLQSGRFKQGRSRLFTVGDKAKLIADSKQHLKPYKEYFQFCCLGVLVQQPELFDEYTSCAHSQTSLLHYPKNNLITPEFWKIPEVIQSRLIDRNDLMKWNFKKIAKWIKKYIEPKDDE